MARVMYIEAFAGAAGDMILGALIDAGLPADELRQALGSLGVGHDLVVTKVLRAGVSATHVEVVSGVEDLGGPHRTWADTRGHETQRTAADARGHDHDHPHAHDHPHPPGHHGHHSLKEITHRIHHSAISAAGKARAVAMFRRLAEAEAAIHAMPVDEVHLHEVGAVDSIIDVVGAVFAFEWWGIDDIVVSPVNVGHGTVTIAHGTFPVPAPATLRLIGHAPVYSRGPAVELLTPTGALVLTTVARTFGAMPPMSIERVGYGAGTRDIPAFPNVLRVVIGERMAAPGDEPGGAADPSDRLLRIECAIDDMTPQLFGPVLERLLAAGAVDAYLTPVQMKKGRPGTLVTALAPCAARAAICDLLFRETTTIGVRFDEVERETLDRSWVEVSVEGGRVRIKVAGRGGAVLNAVPEFDDCVRVSESTGRPIKAVQTDALRAWFELTREPNK